MGDEAEQFNASSSIDGQIVVSTYGDREGEKVAMPIRLRGDEAVVIACRAD